MSDLISAKNASLQHSLSEVYHQCTRALVQFYHVVSVKNVKDPSSLEAQQIPLITSLSPPSADLLHSLILSTLSPIRPPGLFGWGVGGLSFSVLGFSLGVSNDSWNFKAVLGGNS